MTTTVGGRAPVPVQEPRMELAVAFDALSREQKQARITIADQKARAGTCMLCRQIIKKERHNEWKDDSRKAHLMLCANPDAAWNKKYQ